MGQAKQKPLYATPIDIEDDFHQWCFEQAELIRKSRFAEADLPNIIEELESLGREQVFRLKSSYRLLIAGLLKWQFDPACRSSPHDLAILHARFSIEDTEEMSVSLRECARRFVDEVYRYAVHEAAIETGLPREAFPADCPYPMEQLRDLDWMPG